ncbi:AI-2E family transporter [Lichenihabitans sp. Uapishka_5]|nr:AI-2E family transporter [Lichenihabitans sp. Uapishka_5]MDX7952453.1 AI-2E family transporter [Lichenihabitans sp. Uapishka_5]
MQRYARTALVIGLALLGLWIIHDFLGALVWAAILTVALWPVFERACRWWPAGRRIVWPALFTSLAGLVIIVPLVLIAVQVGRESRDAFAFLHDLESNGIPVPDWVGRLPVGAKAVADWWTLNLATTFDTNDVLRRFSHGSLFSVTREYGAKFAHRLVTFVFTLFTLFFLFRAGDHVKLQLLEASQRVFGPKGETLARQMVASIHGTVDGLVLVGIGEGAAMGVAYLFTGVPHPVLLGAVTAVAAMIPFGAAAAFGGAGIYLLIQGAPGLGILVVAIGLAVVGIADHLVRPAVIGGATQLPFLWVLLGILGGVETFGLFGLFLGPAVMSALILLWRELVGPRAEPVSPA